MTSHELARVLLTIPDLPVATHASNHTYRSENDRLSHGGLGVGRLKTCGSDHIILGNMHRKKVNYPNEYITEVYVGNISED